MCVLRPAERVKEDEEKKEEFDFRRICCCTLGSVTSRPSDVNVQILVLVRVRPSKLIWRSGRLPLRRARASGDSPAVR